MFVTIVLTASFIFMACFTYLQARNSIFRNLQLPHPEPGLLFGNLLDFFTEPLPLQLRKWTKQFGKVYGYMEGGKPVLVSSDLNVLQDVFVTKFGNFHTRKAFPLASDPDKSEEASVFAARGLRWKRLRAITSPAFSAAKLRRLVPTVERSVDRMIDIMDARADAHTPFNIHANFQDLTLDVIAKVAFGESRDLQDNPDNPYLDLCRSVFAPRKLTSVLTWFSLFATILPELKFFIRLVLQFFLLFKPIAFRKLIAKVKKVVLERKQAKDGGGASGTDFIQLFLDAEAEEGWQKNDATSLKWDESKAQGVRIDRKLTLPEIGAQCNLFLLAGFDTTSNALAYTAYLLALHPDYQEMLYDELDSVWPERESLNTEALMKLPLLDQVLKEALRMYPLASIVNARECQTACYVGDVWVPAGMTVQADVWSIHYDPDVWGEDADQFRPERFAEGGAPRHPLAWQPFGAGPRTCIGMRFAVIEEKIALARIIRRFRIETCADTQIPLTLQGTSTISPQSVDVVLKRR